MVVKSPPKAWCRPPWGPGRLTCLWVGLSLAVTLPGAPAVAQDDLRRIEWRDHEFAPFYIWNGPAKGQGIADVISEMIRGEMEGWTHSRVLSDVVDTTRRMRAGEQICSAAYVKTPSRESYLVFSIPDMILPPNGITIRRADRERFGGGGEVALSALIQDPSLKLAIAQGRSYGSVIDTIIDRHRSSPHVYSRLSPDVYRTLFEMLLNGSTDYIIGYPYEAAFVARQLGVEEQIVSLPIVENREYVLSHVVCSKTPWGSAAIEEINAAIRRLRPREDYRHAIEQWLAPEQLEDFRRHYREEFLNAE